MNTVWNVLRWTVAALACLWLALCTAVGPIYRADGSITDFSAANAAMLVVAFAAYFGMVVGLTRLAGRRRNDIPRVMRDGDERCGQSPSEAGGKPHDSPARDARPRGFLARHEEAILRATDRTWKLYVILVVGWLWCYATLLSAFGADLFSQIREFSSFWAQTHGDPQTYLDGTGVVNTIMDVYPTAHYLWPADPTFLTNQHNILLTLLYGGVAFASRSLTGAVDAGIIVLSGAQFLFAAFCCAATANRFLNMPFLRDRPSPAPPHQEETSQPERLPSVSLRSTAPLDPEGSQLESPAPPDRGSRPADAGLRGSDTSTATTHPASPATATPAARITVLALLLLNPIIVVSTIALTKSPLFAFTFVWWFGVLYELHSLHTPARTTPDPTHTAHTAHTTPTAHAAHAPAHTTPITASITTPRIPTRTVIALTVSTLIMLASAKYAVYIVALLLVLALLADRRRWRTWTIALLIPLIAFQGMLTALTATHTIIDGDAIESKGIQLQQIGRVVQRNPQGIPQSARDRLAPIIDLDAAAKAYFPQDADRMKSSGSAEDKTIVYRWKTVTADDMTQFNKAWLEIGKANPVLYIDAALAKSYGYFDVTDLPYVSALYYMDNGVIKTNAPHIAGWLGGWRDAIAGVFNGWSRIPVIGWPLHGNFWTILVLVIGAAEVVLRRWRALAFHLPMLLLMGVMITAPANDFDRHMLPLAFVFVFLAIWFLRDTADTAAYGATNTMNRRIRRDGYDDGYSVDGMNPIRP